MANPRYHEEPDWYERPGETVHLAVDANPARHVVPALPWRDRRRSMSGRARSERAFRTWIKTEYRERCTVCRRPIVGDVPLCAYCARAQQRDETAKARARQPHPSRPRIQIREGWEVWASEQDRSDPEALGSGHVREYETRVG